MKYKYKTRRIYTYTSYAYFPQHFTVPVLQYAYDKNRKTQHRRRALVRWLAVHDRLSAALFLERRSGDRHMAVLYRCLCRRILICFERLHLFSRLKSSAVGLVLQIAFFSFQRLLRDRRFDGIYQACR